MAARPRDRDDRRDLVLRRLADQPGVTARALAEEFGTGIRTIFRDLEALRTRGYPVEASRGRGGGLRLAPRWGLGRVLLAREEALAALVALAVADRLGLPVFADDLGRARRRLVDAFPQGERRRLAPLRERVVVGAPASRAVAESYAAPAHGAMRALQAAFADARLLDISYVRGDGCRHRRTIEPHVLLINWPAWYVLAWDLGRGAARTFRVDRLEAATVVDTPFVPRPQTLLAATVEDLRATFERV
ncbi:MAG: helix-turn-helix transcriptional regulator [Gemmatimonadota bacterium]|jgi:predicted DNA-binding transcriptional regulator YafY